MLSLEGSRASIIPLSHFLPLIFRFLSAIYLPTWRILVSFHMVLFSFQRNDQGCCSCLHIFSFFNVVFEILWPSWAMIKKNMMPAMWHDVVLQKSYTATDQREQFSICDKEQRTKTSWHELKQWSHLSVKSCQAHSCVNYFLFVSRPYLITP